MSRRKVEVIIVTDENGDTDWQIDPAQRGHVTIVHVDYRKLDAAFPDDIETMARDVQQMSKGIHWREPILNFLRRKHAERTDELTSP